MIWQKLKYSSTNFLEIAFSLTNKGPTEYLTGQYLMFDLKEIHTVFCTCCKTYRVCACVCARVRARAYVCLFTCKNETDTQREKCTVLCTSIAQQGLKQEISLY